MKACIWYKERLVHEADSNFQYYFCLSESCTCDDRACERDGEEAYEVVEEDRKE